MFFFISGVAQFFSLVVGFDIVFLGLSIAFLMAF